MEEDLFQGDLQDYLENGNLYERCYFQWSLVQCLSHGKCSILVAYNLDLAQQSIQSFFFDVFRVNII